MRILYKILMYTRHTSVPLKSKVSCKHSLVQIKYRPIVSATSVFSEAHFVSRSKVKVACVTVEYCYCQIVWEIRLTSVIISSLTSYSLMSQKVSSKSR